MALKLRRPEIYSPRLRIVLDPIYVSIANLAGSSTYHKYVTLCRELVKRGHFIYWLVPDAEYEPDPIESHPNVGVIRSSYIQDQFIIDGMLTDEFFNLFNRMSGKYHVDVLCTSRNSLALNYKRVLEAPRFHDQGGDHAEFTDKSYGLPVVIIEEFPQTPKRQFTSRSYWLSQVLGYFSADSTIFLSEHNKSEVVEATDMLTTTAIKAMTDKFRVIPAGIECDELDKIYQPDRWKVEQGFNVLCVGRIFGPSYAIFIQWADYLYKLGMSDFSFTISLSGALSGPMRAKIGKFYDLKNNVGRQFNLIENNPRSNFLKMLQKYTCFVCPLSHLDHPTGLLECIYLGLPGIIPKSDYQQSFFADWPWVIDPSDKVALLAKLKEIRDDPAAARDKVKHWRKRIRDNYDAPTNIIKVADEIEKAGRSHINRFRTSNGVINFCKALTGRKYHWGDILAYLKKAGHTGVSIGDMTMRSTFTYSRGAINHAMKAAGFVDDCSSPYEVFVRRDVFDGAQVQAERPGKRVLRRKRDSA